MYGEKIGEGREEVGGGKDFGYKEESWLSLAWNAENSLSLSPVTIKDAYQK